MIISGDQTAWTTEEEIGEAVGYSLHSDKIELRVPGTFPRKKRPLAVNLRAAKYISKLSLIITCDQLLHLDSCLLPRINLKPVGCNSEYLSLVFWEVQFFAFILQRDSIVPSLQTT